MNRRWLLAVALLPALALTACGTTQPNSGAPGGHGLPTDRAPVGAARVTPDFGWVLTAQQLLLTHDGGATFSSVKVPVPASPVRTAYFSDAANGTVAAAAGDAITVAITNDGGNTWRPSSLRDPSAGPAGYSALALSFGDPRHGALIARTATSPAFSQGTLFATADGGATWSSHPAPEAGRVSVEPGGRIWLAGAMLNMTTDQGANWTAPQLNLNGAATAAAVMVSTPVAGVLPVTVATGEATRVLLLSSSDQGRSWNVASSVQIRGRTGAGVRVAVAGTASGLVVLDTAGAHAYLPARGTDLHPSGLTEGVHDVTFGSGGVAGWALATYGTCASAKRDCTLHHELLRTENGGAAWQTLGAWTEPVG
jgi:hypothetical protein